MITERYTLLVSFHSGEDTNTVVKVALKLGFTHRRNGKTVDIDGILQGPPFTTDSDHSSSNHSHSIHSLQLVSDQSLSISSRHGHSTHFPTKSWMAKDINKHLLTPQFDLLKYPSKLPSLSFFQDIIITVKTSIMFRVIQHLINVTFFGVFFLDVDAFFATPDRTTTPSFLWTKVYHQYRHFSSTLDADNIFYYSYQSCMSRVMGRETVQSVMPTAGVAGAAAAHWRRLPLAVATVSRGQCGWQSRRGRWWQGRRHCRRRPPCGTR